MLISGTVGRSTLEPLTILGTWWAASCTHSYRLSAQGRAADGYLLGFVLYVHDCRADQAAFSFADEPVQST